MLSDNFIHGFNILCSRQFEHVMRLQDPLLGQTAQFSVMKNQQFLQILHNNRAHWVATSTNNCKKDKVIITSRINDFVKQQIYALLQADEDVLKINVMPVQRQANSVGCGIFAMAFLTCILFDEDEGLLQMLAEQHIRRFPTFSLELCCSCVQP